MEKQDLGHDNIGKLLIAFAVPCVISMLINSVYNIVDQIFIGQGVGLLGNAATNVIFPLVIFFCAVAGLLGNGCAANMSLRLGEGNKEEAKSSVASTTTLTIASAIIISIIAYIFLPGIINAFGCTPNVYKYALTYGRIIVIGAPALITYTALSSIVRADGSPKYSMFFLVTGAIINVFLDALFILVFKWGVAGGALATIIGQYISMIMSLLYLRRFKNFKIKIKDYKINKSIFKVLSYGLSSFVTQITVLVLFVFMNNMLTKFGAATKFGEDIPLSAYGIMSKVNSLLISSVLGIAIGAQPIIGFNYGAGKKDRVKEIFKKVYVLNLLIASIFNIIYLLFPTALVSIFGSGDNPLYLEFATSLFRIFLMISFINSFEMTTSIVIQSLGSAKKAAACTFIRQIILFIPIALILSNYFGLYGILYAGPIADILCFIIVFFIFLSEYRKLNDIKTEEVEENITIDDKKGIVVAINREYASGGRYVGRLLANSLNIPFYDEDIIKITAKESGFREEYIEENDEHVSNSFSSEYNSDDLVFVAESKVIKDISKKSGVIVGRCAPYILKDNSKVYKVLLYSDMDNKIKRAVKYYGVKKKDAYEKIEKTNKERDKYYKYYTGKSFYDFKDYDLAINVDTLGVEETAKMIKNIVSLNKE